MELLFKTQRGETILGGCSMDSKEEFDTKLREFKEQYGYKNVWFDRCYTSRTITFLKR